jgi:hypothetical protein
MSGSNQRLDPVIYCNTSDRRSIFASKLCRGVTRLQQFDKIRVGGPYLLSRIVADPL